MLMIKAKKVLDNRKMSSYLEASLVLSRAHLYGLIFFS